MRKSIKSIVTITLIMVLLISIDIYGQELGKNVGVAKPKFTHTLSVDSDLSISKYGRASIFMSVLAYSDVDEIKVASYLKRYEDKRWHTVERWSSSEYATNMIFEDSIRVSAGYDYKVVFVVSLYKDGREVESYIEESDTIYY